jgi:hypothetical protein
MFAFPCDTTIPTQMGIARHINLQMPLGMWAPKMRILLWLMPTKRHILLGSQLLQ